MALLLPIPIPIHGVSSSSSSCYRSRSASRLCRVWGWGLLKIQRGGRTQTPTPTKNSLGLSNSTFTKTKSSKKRREAAVEAESDAISILNERIRREQRKKSSEGSPMEAEEADKYLELVKQQQQRGLQKLKGDLSYKVDPYTLRSGDYVVHKKVGIGRFVAIKFDNAPASMDPIEYVFIEYADGMAKLPVKQASRLLYRYNLPNENKKPPTLSKLNDTSVWERRKTKGKIAIQKMVVDLMELYLHRLKQTRPPYPLTPAMAHFVSQFPYEPTPDQKQGGKLQWTA